MVFQIREQSRCFSRNHFPEIRKQGECMKNMYTIYVQQRYVYIYTNFHVLCSYIFSVCFSIDIEF